MNHEYKILVSPFFFLPVSHHLKKASHAMLDLFTWCKGGRDCSTPGKVDEEVGPIVMVLAITLLCPPQSSRDVSI